MKSTGYTGENNLIGAKTIQQNGSGVGGV